MARFGNNSKNRFRRTGFTLIDVLVSVSVIAVLIGILLPSLGQVNKTARRVVCASNIRQIGLGLRSYADTFQGYLPPSVYVPGWANRNSTYRPQEMMRIRHARAQDGLWSNSWDGLGRLYFNSDLPAAKIFFCPAHSGEHPFTQYSLSFGDEPREIISNYQYRGRAGSDNSRNLDHIIPLESALVSDGMSTKRDFNHQLGMNVLRGDQSVVWFSDTGRTLWTSLPESGSGGEDNTEQAYAAVLNAWNLLDSQAPRDGDR